jgi:flagellar protein FliO/FliZ
MPTRILSFLSLTLPGMAWAAETARPAYVPPAPAVSSGGILQIIVSLLLVLAAIVLVGWMLKRMNVAQQGAGKALKVLGGVAIGQRERLMLVEVDNTWLVIGVGPGQIRTLHTLDKPLNAADVEEAPAVTENKFAAVLGNALNALKAGKRDAP